MITSSYSTGSASSGSSTSSKSSTSSGSSTASTSSGSSGSSTSSTSGTSNSSMGQSDFLKLLVTQLKNQDPTNPMDSTQMTTQMAQFSSLEQLMNINTGLTSLLSASNSTTSAQALNLIGKEVTTQGDSTYVTDGKAANIAMALASDASSVTVTIKDQNGSVVRTLTSGSKSSGAQSLAWDGKDSSGNTLADGLYNYSVAATDASGNSVDVTTYATGVVTTISFDNGKAYVHIGDIKYLLSEVVEVKNPTASSTSSTSSSGTTGSTSSTSSTSATA